MTVQELGQGRSPLSPSTYTPHRGWRGFGKWNGSMVIKKNSFRNQKSVSPTAKRLAVLLSLQNGKSGGK